LKNYDKALYGDIKIAGFTNSAVVELFTPSITSVRQPAFEMGQVATQMLIKLIESKYPVEEFETRVLDTELIAKNAAELT
jgi:LacI family transcriptional regulator